MVVACASALCLNWIAVFIIAGYNNPHPYVYGPIGGTYGWSVHLPQIITLCIELSATVLVAAVIVVWMAWNRRA